MPKSDRAGRLETAVVWATLMILPWVLVILALKGYTGKHN